MPREKSFSSSSLRDISLKFVATHIYLFQLNALKELPETLIRELYEECCGKVHNLPSELFVTASTLRLSDFHRFDVSRREIFNRICKECKNLQKLYFDGCDPQFTSEKISQLFMSIPKIEHLDLESCNITDQHLSLIGHHCPLLRHLSLDEYGNNNVIITEKGINFLSNTQIHYLDLSLTNVTPEICVSALKNLKKLTTFLQDYWEETIELLQAEQDTDGKPVTTSYSIESVRLPRGKFAYRYNVGKTIAMLFPKLKELRMEDPRLHTSFIFLVQNMGKNLTDVNICKAPLDTIRLIGHFCPMLEDLGLNIDAQIEKSYDECLETPCDHVPYKHLRSLGLSVKHGCLPRKWLEKLLQNCHLLETLSFNSCYRISDDFSFVMQLGNQFRHLNTICFRFCNEFSLSAVQMLLEFLPVVTDVWIYYCLNSSNRLLLKEYVKNNNWDLWLFDEDWRPQ